MNDIKVGFALCGSLCTLDRVMEQFEKLCELYSDVTPIMSEASSEIDSRFGNAEDFVRRAQKLSGKEVIRTIKDAEPIGPKKLFDILIIAPCTGNTIAKLANGITDSCVTMAAKAHLRNEKPLLLAVSTNDGLAGAASNIGSLLNRRNIYFVPFGQDDPFKKPRSLVAKFELIPNSIEAAVKGIQIQPILQ